MEHFSIKKWGKWRGNQQKAHGKLVISDGRRKPRESGIFKAEKNVSRKEQLVVSNQVQRLLDFIHKCFCCEAAEDGESEVGIRFGLF